MSPWVADMFINFDFPLFEVNILGFFFHRMFTFIDEPSIDFFVRSQIKESSVMASSSSRIFQVMLSPLFCSVLQLGHSATSHENCFLPFSVDSIFSSRHQNQKSGISNCNIITDNDLQGSCLFPISFLIVILVDIQLILRQYIDFVMF